MTSCCKKLRLLIWKNYILHKRSYILTFFEFFVPLLFIIILILFRIAKKVEKEDQITNYHPIPLFQPTDYPANGSDIYKYNVILYTPKRAKRIMNDVCKNYFNINNYTCVGFDSEDEMIYNYKNRPKAEIKMRPEDWLNPAALGEEDADTRKKKIADEDQDESVYGNPILAGVVFNNIPSSKNKHANIEYKLRFHGIQPKPGIYTKTWQTVSHYTHPDTILIKEIGPRNPSLPTGGRPDYFLEGFVYLQNAIDTQIIKIMTKDFDKKQAELLSMTSPIMPPTFPGGNKSNRGVDNDNYEDLDDFENMDFSELDKFDKFKDASLYDVRLQRYPIEPFLIDFFVSIIAGVIPFVIVFTFMFYVINTTKNIVIEKEFRLKQAMLMMGLPNWMQWLAWFLKSIILLFFIVLCLTITFKISFGDGAIMSHTDGTVLFVLLFSYALAVISFTFLVSTSLSISNSAVLASAGYFYLTFMPYFLIDNYYYSHKRAVKLSLSLLANTAIAFGCTIISDFEADGRGVDWSTIGEPSSPDDNISLQDVILMLNFDTISYFLIALYIEAVFPGEYGIPQPFYFPFTRRYWCGPRQRINDEIDDHKEENKHKSSYFESHPKGLKAGVNIKHLRKKFGKKLVVKDVKLKMFENQITVLLGHNGAGKTTTISMLTGLIPPTKGTATINGYDIIKEIKNVHDSLGMCPQFDILYDQLTVTEHLQFFLGLKGVKGPTVILEINRILILLNMQDKRKAKAYTLSGGMKRKLSIGIALCGESKIVLLDEPTSGMDPHARRFIWDILKSEKKNRTILLSTHFMDEADYLGDRIAIMADGDVECCGSPLFLKKKYGGGYHLVIVKAPKCEVSKITELLRKYIPKIKVGEDVAAELTFSLSDAFVHSFPDMFDDLDLNMETLGIMNYGVSITTIEEVFIKVGKEAEKRRWKQEHPGEKMDDDNNRRFSTVSRTSSIGAEKPKTTKTYRNELKMTKDKNRYCQQFQAMLVKKCLFTYRNMSMFFIQVIIPVVILVLSLLSDVTSLAGTFEDPKLVMNLKKFGHTVTPTICQKNRTTTSAIVDFCGIYSDLHSSTTFIDIPKEEDLENITKEARRKDKEFDNKYIIGLNTSTGSEVTIIGLFNGQAIHSSAISLNYISNAILKQRESNGKITTVNHPFPLLFEEIEERKSYKSKERVIADQIAVALCFLASSFVFFLIKERSVSAKHLQLASGLNLSIFWAGNILFDIFNWLTIISLMIILLTVFQIDSYKTSEILGHLYVIFFIFGMAVIPMMYVFSFVISKPATGICLAAMYLFLGIFLPPSILELALNQQRKGFNTTVALEKEKENEKITRVVHWLFIIFPSYFLKDAIVEIIKNGKLRVECPPRLKLDKQLCKFSPTDRCCNHFKKNFLEWDAVGVGRHVTLMAICSALFFLILILIEFKVFDKCLSCRKHKKMKEKVSFERRATFGIADTDVVDEIRKITETELSELFKKNNLIVKNLSKYYMENYIVAVNRLNLGVLKGECFGLLGINGAGKTTTFKMITGDIKMSTGDVYINSRSVKDELKESRKSIGYCPQYDSLIDELTGRETLRLFSRIRGIHKSIIENVINEIAKNLLFTQYLDKRVGNYSGGNKRKVSIAVAMIGNPEIILADEPSTGMDPVAKRYLWEILKRETDSGISIILTSHSMEECEALCTRIGIMVSGQFKCLGSPQHLKSKFGEGYTLIIKCPTSDNFEEMDENGIVRWWHDLEPIRMYIEQSYPGSEMKDSHPGYLHYHITDKTVSVGKMFEMMEKGKEKYHVEAYSIGQTTLEQVFLHFTMHQEQRRLSIDRVPSKASTKSGGSATKSKSKSKNSSESETQEMLEV